MLFKDSLIQAIKQQQRKRAFDANQKPLICILA